MYQHPAMSQEQRPTPRREHYQLYIRQEPEKARVVLKDKEKDRKPIDPPPIVQLQVFNESDLNRHFLHNPYLFMCCTLEEDPDQLKKSKDANASKLLGTVTSSLHRLKDPAQGNNEGGFFVFGDISVQTTGRHHLRFTLHEFDIASNQTVYITELRSAPFDVLSPRDWEGPTESTHLSRAFVDQGVRLRLRKEPRTGARRQIVTRAPLPMQGPPGGPQAPLASLGHHTNSYGSQSSQDQEGTATDEPDAKRRRTLPDNSYQAQYPGQPPTTQPYSQYPQPAPGGYAYNQVYPGSQQRYTPYPAVPQDPAAMSQYPGYYSGPQRSGQYSRTGGQEQQQPSSAHAAYASPSGQIPPGYPYQQMPDGQQPVPGRSPYYQQQYGYQGMVASTSSTPAQMPYQTANDNYSQFRQQGAGSPASYGPYRPGQPPQSSQQGQQGQPTVASVPPTSQAHDAGYQQRASMQSTQSSDRLPPIQVSDPDAAVASVETDQQPQDRTVQGYSSTGQIPGGSVSQY